MKALYDSAADALYLRFSEGSVVESEEVRPGIVVDLDASGRIIAIEVIDAREHLAAGTDLSRLTAA